MKFFLSLLVAATAIFAFESNLFSQVLYSYIDGNGIQNFTNVAPLGPVSDLKITGALPQPPLQSDSKGKSGNFDPLIEKYAADYGFEPSLIRSIIATESGFNPKAVSPKGARGLMQLMPETATRLGVRNSFDPEQNIQGGVKHFRFLMDNFNNNLELSLAAYNAGENLVQKLGRVPAIQETRDYVQSVTKRYGKKEIKSQAQAQEPPRPETLRFMDESGILHITNVPPSR
jgi:soluble lytic murein transglycosylase